MLLDARALQSRLVTVLFTHAGNSHSSLGWQRGLYSTPPLIVLRHAQSLARLPWPPEKQRVELKSPSIIRLTPIV